MMQTTDPLSAYQKKRDFSVTPEPTADAAQKTTELIFVVQKHAARSLHYDFRLALDGMLKSWAVPKGPSLDPKEKRLAVHVEDHPLAYAEFSGEIPAGQYGAGTVEIWDHGTWEPLENPREGLAAGQLKFQLHGEKLRGAWALIRMRGKAGEKQEPWLLIKERDAYAQPEREFKVLEVQTESAAIVKEALEIPTGANLEPLPAFLPPQLATLVDSIPASSDWHYEIKFDGYRIMARFTPGDVALFTRNGHNWTAKLPALAAALRSLKIDSGWLDGEIVMLGKDGLSDFAALQGAFESARTDEIRYYVFDLPFYAGFDLRQVPLAERRRLLAGILSETSLRQVKFSEDFAASGSEMLRNSCQLGLEGVIGKRKKSFYQSGRSLNWIKLKCVQRQEFVVVGYTAGKGGNSSIGALLLGVYDQAGHLRYAGKVGSGFDNQTAAMLQEKLANRVVEGPALFEPPKDARGIWVEPELVAEIAFAGWTEAGRVRHAVFHGLRSDKPAAAIVRETAQQVTPAKKNKTLGVSRAYHQSLSAAFVAAPISNPERVIDASSGLRKLDIVNYYQMAAKWMLPHLAHRPVSFLRAPAGIEGQMFFQKHGGSLKIPGLKHLDLALDPGHPALMEIDSLEALIGAVQMNVLEFHTWNATTENMDQPDRMVFDLDPGEKITWPLMLEAAELTRVLLEELGLQSYLKTSGGKGLHIVVPISPQEDWQTVKAFSKKVAEHLAKVVPSLFTAVSGPKNRVGKVFVDYNRNGRGATTVAAFSTRARPGIGVSMPCAWAELSLLTGGDHWNIKNLGERLASGVDPWQNYSRTEQDLREAMESQAGKVLLLAK